MTEKEIIERLDGLGRQVVRVRVATAPALEIYSSLEEYAEACGIEVTAAVEAPSILARASGRRFETPGFHAVRYRHILTYLTPSPVIYSAAELPAWARQAWSDQRRQLAAAFRRGRRDSRWEP